MCQTPPPSPLLAADVLTAYFHDRDRDGNHEAMRSRGVSGVVHTATLGLPALPARLVADWAREITVHMALEAGDVEPLPLARARARWPGYTNAVQAMSHWTRSIGLGDTLADAEVALMACRGARYHHDAVQYGGAAFCNLFVSDDKGLDLHFPHADRRIPLQRGTAVLFDTGQPHAVVPRGSSRFDAAEFAAGVDCSQFFLTWELPIDDAGVVRALCIDFDTDLLVPSALDEAQLQRNGRAAVLCPTSGGWRTRA